MGTSRSAGELARKLVTFERQAVPQAVRVGTLTAAKYAQGVGVQVMTAHGLPPGKLWRTGDRGTDAVSRRRYGVRYKTEQGPMPSVKVYAYGPPAYITHYGARPHFIFSRQNKVRVKRKLGQTRTGALTARAASDRALVGVVRTPFGPRASVRHPGVKARPFWPQVEAIVYREAPRIMRREMAAGMVRHFR